MFNLFFVLGFVVASQVVTAQPIPYVACGEVGRSQSFNNVVTIYRPYSGGEVECEHCRTLNLVYDDKTPNVHATYATDVIITVIDPMIRDPLAQSQQKLKPLWNEAGSSSPSVLNLKLDFSAVVDSISRLNVHLSFVGPLCENRTPECEQLVVRDHCSSMAAALLNLDFQEELPNLVEGRSIEPNRIEYKTLKLESEEFSREVEERLERLGLSEGDYQKIISYVSGNEFRNDPEGIIDWNEGEDFASLGMGHFIWYPEGVEQRFTESFPKMARFLWSRWPSDGEVGEEDEESFLFARDFFYRTDGSVRFCPWRTRQEFLTWKRNRRDEWSHLVRFLNHPLTKRIQVAYLDADFRSALVSLYGQIDSEEDLRAMEADADETIFSIKAHVRGVILSLLRTKEGATALMDYVNFKGDGVDARMRYSGVGWGLQQVLYWTDLEEDSLLQWQSFARASLNRLSRRAQLATRPIERDVWLHGWANRVLGYGYVDSDPFIVAMRQEQLPSGELRWPKLHIGDRALRDLFD